MKFSAAILLFAFFSDSSLQNQKTEVCLSVQEFKLYSLIMGYRKSKGLDEIPLSAKLTQVAQAHTHDLSDNYIFEFGNKCNPHSWSTKGKWSPCCYTPDHKQAKCMWDKPKEIANYNSPGYEIAYYDSDSAKAEVAIAGWKSSPAHNPLLINEGTWSKIEWRAIGISIYKEYSVVWFGNITDNAVSEICVN